MTPQLQQPTGYPHNTRSRVAALVSAWGDRIQRSVYSLLLDVDDLDDLLSRIEELINLDRDAVHVFVQCQACDAKLRNIGQATVPTPDPYWIL